MLSDKQIQGSKREGIWYNKSIKFRQCMYRLPKIKYLRTKCNEIFKNSVIF